ncbi:MAG: hypothetical protein WD070_07025, partial [Pirellulaceae bacterium]
MPLFLRLIVLISVTLVAVTTPARGQLQNEADYYRIVPFDIPAHINLEAGGIELMPDGQLAISTRRGEIFMIDKPFADPPEGIRWSRYASGLHEVLGIHAAGDWLYATQRCELTRLKDEDGDGRADLFETVNDDWEITGDYHEYAFGSPPDADG